jgi:hypothetical protein
MLLSGEFQVHVHEESMTCMHLTKDEASGKPLFIGIWSAILQKNDSANVVGRKSAAVLSVLLVSEDAKVSPMTSCPVTFIEQDFRLFGFLQFVSGMCSKHNHHRQECNRATSCIAAATCALHS